MDHSSSVASGISNQYVYFLLEYGLLYASPQRNVEPLIH